MLREPVTVCESSLLLLQETAIGQQDLAERGCRLGCVNGAFETAVHQTRQVAAVIDVRVSQDDGIELFRVEGR